MMAPSVVDQNTATAQLENAVSKPPPGVVLPPKDIRAVVERAAGYVVRNGSAFEDRIRDSEMNNPKFSFLASHDAYHPYYQWRLEEIQAGRGTVISAGRVGEQQAKKEPERPKGPPEPPEPQFCARMPNMNAMDLDVVRLTALFAAKNGRSFATSLVQRETETSQFDFLRPQHSLNGFYTRMVDQYTSLINGGLLDDGKLEQARITEIEKTVKNKYRILDKAKRRVEWTKYKEQEKEKKEAAEEAEKQAYAAIDWHNFVVVETVLFTEEDEYEELAPPTSLADLQTASLEQRASMSLAPASMRIEEAVPTSEDYSQNSSQQQIYAQPPPAPAQHLPTIPPPQIQLPSTMSLPQRPEMHTIANAPRTMSRRSNVATSICPYCKLPIPMDEMEQHLKIEQLDPRAREQRLKAEQRAATTNLSTQDVAENLKRLASQRTDVFDPISGRPETEEELAKLKKAKGENAPGFLNWRS